MTQCHVSETVMANSSRATKDAESTNDPDPELRRVQRHHSAYTGRPARKADSVTGLPRRLNRLRPGKSAVRGATTTIPVDHSAPSVSGADGVPVCFQTMLASSARVIKRGAARSESRCNRQMSAVNGHGLSFGPVCFVRTLSSQSPQVVSCRCGWYFLANCARFAGRDRIHAVQTSTRRIGSRHVGKEPP